MRENVAISICGSAGGKLDKAGIEGARKIGQALANQKAIVMTGATTGYTYEAAIVARRAGGITIGISPAKNRSEQKRSFSKPIDAWTKIIYTGMGLKGRNVVMVLSSDACIFIGGGTGTLNEFTIAYDEGRPIGILKGVPGCLELADEIVSKTYKLAPPIMKEKDPEKLAKRVLQEAKSYTIRTSR